MLKITVPYVSRATYQATDWFYNHLAGAMPVVMVTNDKQVCFLK